MELYNSRNTLRAGRMNMLDKLKCIFSTITSAIVVCTLIYNAGFKSNFKREKEYYEVILKMFIGSLVSEKNENVLKQIKGKISHTDDFVPKYVLYLVDKGEDEKLLKVLLYDYFDIYPNDDNSINRSARVLTKGIICILLFMAIAFFIWGCICLYMGVEELILGSHNGFRIDNVCYEILSGILCFVLYLFTIWITKIINNDRYTTQKKKIEKMIRKKIDTYDRKHDEYVY